MSRRLQIGEQLGDYRIAGFLGAGGMGAVYHGIHTKINRSAAIKILSDVVGNSTLKERFFNEARLQSSLHHPNIATLYDFQESGDLIFIVMEYVDGETLEALIRRRYFAVEDALKTFQTICDAVAFIHGNNIVHRDIKPQNIKISANGMVKMLDFGIAKDSVSNGLTRIGGIIGTPSYLAPEQLLGSAATPLSDIWALGILFYEMLTGTEPFKGSTLGELRVQITTAKYEEPEKLNSAVPPEVSRIVRKCLEVLPEQRYQSVAAIALDVRRARTRYEPVAENKAEKPSAFPGKGLFRRTDRVSAEGSGTENGSREGVLQTIGGFPHLRLAAGVGAVILVSVFVGFGIWATSLSAIGNSNSSNTSLTNTDTARFRESKPATVRNEQVAMPQYGEVARSGERHRVTVHATEGAADVFRNGQFIGTTPIEIEGLENEIVGLTLKRAAYDDLDVKVEIAIRRKVNTFALKRR